MATDSRTAIRPVVLVQAIGKHDCTTLRPEQVKLTLGIALVEKQLALQISNATIAPSHHPNIWRPSCGLCIHQFLTQLLISMCVTKVCHAAWLWEMFLQAPN